MQSPFHPLTEIASGNLFADFCQQLGMIEMKVEVFLQTSNAHVMSSSLMEPIHNQWQHFVGKAHTVVLIVMVTHQQVSTHVSPSILLCFARRQL